MDCPVTRTKQARTAAFASAGPIRLKHVLVAVDFAANGRALFSWGLRLVRDFQATMTLLHVVPVVVPGELSHLALVLSERRSAAGSMQRMADLREVFPKDLPLNTVVLQGEPVHEILRFADQQNVDLILMATHGHSGLKHAFLGSTTEAVLRRAPCPVLVVRA